jgi:hybrid cluster-associated redox disulfide protein
MPEAKVSISAELSVADLLARWPQTVQWFLSHQMSCVGCNMATFDSLQEVAANYRIPIEEFLSDLRKVIEAQPD